MQNLVAAEKLRLTAYTLASSFGSAKPKSNAHKRTTPDLHQQNLSQCAGVHADRHNGKLADEANYGKNDEPFRLDVPSVYAAWRPCAHSTPLKFNSNRVA